MTSGHQPSPVEGHNGVDDHDVPVQQIANFLIDLSPFSYPKPPRVFFLQGRDTAMRTLMIFLTFIKQIERTFPEKSMG